MYGASDRDQLLNDLNDLADWLKSYAGMVKDEFPVEKRFSIADRFEDMADEVMEHEGEIRDGRTE